MPYNQAMIRLFVKQLTVIDFSYLHPQRGLLGESWVTDIELTGSLDHQGMVLDFSEVKKQVKQLIDELFDHKLLVPMHYAGTKIEPQGKRSRLEFVTEDGRKIEHIAPESAYCQLQTEAVTPESLAQAIIEALKPQLPDNVEKVDIHLRPEAIDGPYYHYSHGLKHHAGNCQRIAHGHRSRIEIFENGKQVSELENEWAQRWKDIYIGTRSDLQEEFKINGQSYYRFQYTACQGLFEISLPANNCYLIDVDSTVENLAAHIAGQLKLQYPDRDLSVYAYEGIDKGAIGLQE